MNTNTEIKTTVWDKEKFLRYSEGVVTFLKKDGSVRKMNFTTDLSKIPTNLHPKNDGSRKPSAIVSTIRVFDIDKNEWRSIDLTRIIGVGEFE